MIISSNDKNDGTIDTIKFFVDKKIEIINDSGGIKGTRVRAEYYDDQEDESKAKTIFQKLINDKSLIGIVGLWNSTRGRNVVDIVGNSNVPYIGDFSINSLFENYENIYSIAKGVSEEIAILDEFIKYNKYKKFALIGKKGDLYTEIYFEHIKQLSSSGEYDVILEKWFPKGYKPSDIDISEIIKEIDHKADFIFLSLGSSGNSKIIEPLAHRGIRLPIYTVLGTIGSLLSISGNCYSGDFYDTAEKGIPNVNSQRLEELVEKFKDDINSIELNNYVVGYGGRYADAVGILLKIANSSEDIDVTSIKKFIVKSLPNYQAGKGIYRGWSQDWSFSKNRYSSENVLITWKPEGYDGFILHPKQFVIKENEVATIPVIYLNIDMIRITKVSIADRSFYA